MIIHQLTFVVAATGQEVSGTIELPCNQITDEVVDAFAALFEIAYGDLVRSRSSVGPAFSWATKTKGTHDFTEQGGA